MNPEGKCAICGKSHGYLTVRQSWLDAGGYGYVPPKARVHMACDLAEQHRLTTGSTVTAAPVDLAATNVDDGAAAGEP